MCLGIYQPDPACFLTAPGLAWKAVLKEAKEKLDLLSNIDMYIMIEKCIRGGLCHAIHRYAKTNKKYIENCDKNKELSYLKYWDVNNLHDCVMS